MNTSPPDAGDHDGPGQHRGSSAPANVEPLRLVALPGSERTAPGPGTPRFQTALEPSASDPIQVTVVLRRRAPFPAEALSGPGMSAEQFGAAYGADPADVAAATQRFTALGLQVVDTDAASRRLRVSGTAAAMQRVFGTSLSWIATGAHDPAGPPTSADDASFSGSAPDPHADGYRLRTGGLSIPADLAGIVTAVLGLDDRPQSRSLYRIASPRAVSVSYTPVQLTRIYDFPQDVDGSGQTIAIVELGGGFDQSDLDSYFAGLGVAVPHVVAIGVDGARNDPGRDPGGADGEVLLDIEVAGAMAPGADLVVYFAPNTDAGFLDAVSQAAHATPSPAAISISWGQSEDAWTAQARQAMDSAFADAAALGVTVICAAGDDGSTDRVPDGKTHVDFPAASPHVLACGGTRLEADPESGVVTAETVWNNGSGQGATGGGFSVTFGRPDYQRAIMAPPAAISDNTVHSGSMTSASEPASADDKLSVPADTGRGVPDVAGVADPRTGYQVLVDGQRQVIGGTSAVAPLWAALIARLAQAKGERFGLIHPLLYADEQALRDITRGNNGAYSASPGWDACTGLGVPVGSTLAATLAGHSRQSRERPPRATPA